MAGASAGVAARTGTLHFRHPRIVVVQTVLAGAGRTVTPDGRHPWLAVRGPGIDRLDLSERHRCLRSATLVTAQREEGHGGEQGGHSTKGERRPRARDVADHAEEGGPDRCAAEEGDGVQGHDTAPHRRVGAELERRVVRGHERDGRGSHHDERHGRDDRARRKRHGEDACAENEADESEEPRRGTAPESGVEATDDRPGSHGSHEDAGQSGAAVEREFRQQGQRHGEVEGEHADHGHGEEGVPQLPRGPGVAESLSDLTLGSRHPLPAVQPGGVHHGECGDDGDIGPRVHHEARGDTDRHDEDAPDGRADHPRPVDEDAVRG